MSSAFLFLCLNSCACCKRLCRRYFEKVSIRHKRYHVKVASLLCFHRARNYVGEVKFVTQQLDEIVIPKEEKNITGYCFWAVPGLKRHAVLRMMASAFCNWQLFLLLDQRRAIDDWGPELDLVS